MVGAAGVTILGGYRGHWGEVIESGTVNAISAFYTLINPRVGKRVPSLSEGVDYQRVIDTVVARGLAVMAVEVLGKGAWWSPRQVELCGNSRRWR